MDGPEEKPYTNVTIVNNYLTNETMLNVRKDSFVVTAEDIFKVVFSLFNLFTSDEMFNILQIQNVWEFLVKTFH